MAEMISSKPPACWTARHCNVAGLGLRGSRPDEVEIELMCMHPHKACDEFQARRRILSGFLKTVPYYPYEARAFMTSGSGRACSEIRPNPLGAA
jgi:hypothetical protein